MDRTGRGGKMKKERRFFNAKEKKQQLGISLILLFLLGIGFGWLANMDGLYLSWEKAFYATEEARGYGPSEKILLVQEEKTEGWRVISNIWNPFHTPMGESRYLVGRLPQTEEKGMWNYCREGDHLRYGLGVKYLEGRNAAGEVLYQKWMDDTGKFVEIDPKK